MFSTIRGRLRHSPMGVIAVIALVFAMVGGAYAAGGGLSAKQKKEVKAIAKSFQGTGPAGAQGPAGAAGPAGPAGAAGPAGKDGANGATGATGATGAKGAAGTPGTNGSDGENGATGATGPEGSPWTAGGTLPSGKSEYGLWEFTVPAVVKVRTVASFPIPLKEEVTANRIKRGEGEGEGEENLPEGCSGTYLAPVAAPGHFCLFENGAEAPEEKTAQIGLAVNPELPGFSGLNKAGRFGAGVIELVEEGGRVWGSWVVTAP
jgi:hypothetical protein